MVERYKYKLSEMMDTKVLVNHKDGIVDNILKGVQFIWLLIMCLLPSQFNKVKILLLGILCISCLFDFIRGKKKINVKSMQFTLLFVIIYFIFLVYGIKNGYEIDLKLIEIFCIRPLILFFLVSLVDNKKKFIFFMKSLIIITFIIVIYNLIYMLGHSNIIPQFLPWEDGAVIISDGFLAMRVSNQGTLMYLMPMCIMLISDIKNINFSFRFRTIIKMNIALGTIVVMLSGRRTLQICTIIAFICLFGYLVKKSNINVKTVVIYPIMGVFAVLVALVVANKISKMIGINDLFGSVFSTIYDALNRGQYTGDIRQMQFDILIKEWMKKPLLGWGLSAYVPYFTRSIATKWSYEYVYIAFLFQTGLVGAMVLFTYILSILKKVYKKYLVNKKNEFGVFFIANFIGFMCFLIAGYTNPLVASLWAWLIVLICTNINLENKC